MKPRALKKAVAPPQAVERNPMKTENVCEHGDHPAPEGKRFCSKACRLCESVDGPPCSLECAKEQLAEARAELERLKGAQRQSGATISKALADLVRMGGKDDEGELLWREPVMRIVGRIHDAVNEETKAFRAALSPEPKEGSKP